MRMRRVLGLSVVCALAWGCDDPKGASGGQDEGAQASNEKASEAPEAKGSTTAATDEKPGAAAPAAEPADGEATGGGAPAGHAEPVDLKIEKSTVTLKSGSEEPVTHEMTTGGDAIWTWTADESRNLIYYNANTNEPGAFALAVINMNKPGKTLDLGKVGTGMPAAVYFVYNEKNPEIVGARRAIHAIEGKITAERDPVSGAMRGTFEGSFKSEPTFKPLVTGPEHEPVKVKMSGSFEVQPPPREAVEKPKIGRVEQVTPEMTAPMRR